ncbi:MFS transporter [Chryseobacterium sp. CP-77]|uniref:MFS transporter n=1 Tax=Chryseobacterium sp. CP-77 TaxID=3116594 RepID=UPI002ED47A5E
MQEFHSKTGQNWKTRYVSIFVGQTFSQIGSAVTQFILLWWITDTTGEVSALATAGVLAFLPQALLGPIAGAIADRYNRRMLMIFSDLLSMFCIIILVYLFYTHLINIWHIYVLVAVRGILTTIQDPAADASIPMLVPASFLSNAVGLNQTLGGVITIVSAPLGALAIGLLPIEWALSIDIFTALVGILPLLIFTIPQHINKSKSIKNIGIEIKEGVQIVWNNKGLRYLYFILGAMILVIMPCFTFVPLLVKTYFNGGAPEVAVIEGISGGAMVLGGLVVTFFTPKRKILWIIFGFAASCFSMAATAFVAPSLFWLAVIFWSISGVSFILGNAPLTALLQFTIPNQLQGRALSLLTAIQGLATPLGLGIAFCIGELMSVNIIFIIMGILGGAICLFALTSRQIRKLE